MKFTSLQVGTFLLAPLLWGAASPAAGAPAPVAGPAGANIAAREKAALARLEKLGLEVRGQVHLPRKELRGYGGLGGEWRTLGPAAAAGGSGAVGGETVGWLHLQCDSPARAALTLGKYLLDARRVGQVQSGELKVGRGAVPVLQAAGGPALVAWRRDNGVFVLCGPDASLLVKVHEALQQGETEALFAGTRPPTYLDKWDAAGFGFWGRDVLRTPPGQPNYNSAERLAWAKKMGVGLQFDLAQNQSVGAAGILGDNGNRWALEAARDMNIPMTLQFQGEHPSPLVEARFADEMQMRVPGFVGNYYGFNGNNGFAGSQRNMLSWASVRGKDVVFAQQYSGIEKYGHWPNVLGYGESHGELGSVDLAPFMDFGPLADARYREYLQKKYVSPEALAKRWQAPEGTLRSWADVTLPEPARFLGLDETALDLRGTWRRQMEAQLTAVEKAAWGDPALDVASWPTVPAPGDDRQIFRSKWRQPTVFRRQITLDETQLRQLTKTGKTYWYVLTLQEGANSKVAARVNGEALPEQVQRAWASWVVFELTGKLKAGPNTLAVMLPRGELSYRTYLSSTPPLTYPALGAGRNAQWVDYMDFLAQLRVDSLTRSMEAIRRRDPDKFIKMYAPHGFSDVIKPVVQRYGGYFHDTGSMSGGWYDSLPAHMRSAGLPSSLEPGGPADTVADLQLKFGRWFTEGVNAVDYFMDIGNIMWQADQKEWFEANLPLVQMIGKYHAPASQVAVLEGLRSERYLGFPWSNVETPLLWNTRSRGVGTLKRIPGLRDVISEADFELGNADGYRVIVDDATLIMGEETVQKIEAWVRGGGTFILQGQSGRHTPTVPDAWPIHRISGYRPVGNNDNSRVGAAPDQNIFTNPAWTRKDEQGRPVLNGAGVLLQKVLPECRDVLLWEKGQGVAMGVRELGKGKIITLGTVMPYAPDAWQELLTWCGVTTPAAATAPGCRVSTYRSNSGLYDVYAVWAQDAQSAGSGDGVIQTPTPVTLKIPGHSAPLVDALSGEKLEGEVRGEATLFRGVVMAPRQTRLFYSPRPRKVEAPLEWAQLQRNWWQGTTAPGPEPAAEKWPNLHPLDQGWQFDVVKDWPAAQELALAGAGAMAAPGNVPQGNVPLGVWPVSRHAGGRVGVFRRTFQVPAAWDRPGAIWLWMKAGTARTLLPPYKARIYVDGRQVYDSAGWAYSFALVPLPRSAGAGNAPRHITVVSEANEHFGGPMGNMWLQFVPQPAATEDLSGDWNGITLPGTALFPHDKVRRTITWSGEHRDKRAVLYVETADNSVSGVFLDGRLLNREPGGHFFLMDLSPYLRDGKPHVLTLNSQHREHPVTLKKVELRYYEAGTF